MNLKAGTKMFTVYLFNIEVTPVLHPFTKTIDTKIAFLSQFSVPCTSFSLNMQSMNFFTYKCAVLLKACESLW